MQHVPSFLVVAGRLAVLGSAFVLLAGAILAADEKPKPAKIKTLIAEYIRSTHAPNIDPRPFDIGKACEKDPKAGVRAVADVLSKADMAKKGGKGQIGSGVLILSGLIHIDSIKELDKLYRRAGGDWDLRRSAITALAINQLSLMPPESLIRKFPAQAIPMLAKWLKDEPDPYVLKYGFQVLSDYATELPAGVLANAKGKVSLEQLEEAKRKVKINSAKGSDLAYRQMLVWIKDLVKSAETSNYEAEWRLRHWDLLNYLGRSLRSDPKTLQRHIKEIRQEAKEVDDKLAALAKRMEKTKDEKEMKDLGAQEWGLKGIQHILQWALRSN